MNAKLTDTQTTVLKAAASRADGNIEPLPPNVRGGARAKVIDGLLARGLVAESDGRHLLTDAGYAAVGKCRPVPKGIQNMDALAKHEATNSRQISKGTQNVGASDALQKLEATPPAIRPGTKILTLVELLQEPGGASIVTLLQATGWLPHTIRGAISAIVKKKLGFRVISEKGLSGERIYKIDISTPKSK